MKKYYVFIFIVTIFCFFSFKKSKKDTLEPASTVIVIPDRSNYLETQAASVISKWLNVIYHTTQGFSITKESSVKDVREKMIIAVGDTKFSSLKGLQNLPPYSYIINREENVVTIAGNEYMSTLIGAGYFLDHFCGVRFYIPGDLFTSKPIFKKIELDKTIAIKESPSTDFVYATGFKKYETNWSYINALFRKNWGSHQHTMGERFVNDSVIKKFPEIFPIVNGDRYFPVSRTDQKWQPDFAEPRLVDAAAYSAVQYFKENPSIDYISFSVQDGYSYSKEGKMGKFLKSYPVTPKGQRTGYTEANVEFLNSLAKKLKTILPENGITRSKTIIYLVYNEVNKIPLEKLDPSILPVLVFHVAETLMDSVYQEGPDGLKNYRLSEWGKVTSRIGNHDWAEGRGFIYPRIYTNLVSKFARTVKRDKMNFEYAHIEAYPNWSLDGPKLYFMGKIYWNPEVNTDSLLTLFCKDMFGPAKDDMKNYFTTLENLNTCMNNDPTRNRRLNSYITQLPLSSKELQMVHQARRYLDAASIEAPDDDIKKRIDFFSKGFKISESFFDLYNFNSGAVQKGAALKKYLQNTVARDSMLLNVATDKDFIEKTNASIDQIIKAKKN
ncbi:MAG: DUF4838 domain-containing protein [Ginsengibacter sp.]